MQLSISDAARLLDSSEDRVYQWIDEGSIPHYEVNEQFRFNKAELLEWATSRGMRVSVEIFETHVEPPSLVEALKAGGVHLDVPATDRETLVGAIAKLLPIKDDADRELIVEVLLAREAIKSTIGDGIAIPHVRNPIVLHGTRAAIALCHLNEPIDLKAIDGRPITLVFMMVTPTPKAHLQLLSRLSAALHDPAFRAAIKRRASLDELLAEASRIEATFRARRASQAERTPSSAGVLSNGATAKVVE